MGKPKKAPAMVVTLPPASVKAAIVSQVAFDLGIDDLSRISVRRVTRKKGGEVEAEVAVAPLTLDEE